MMINDELIAALEALAKIRLTDDEKAKVKAELEAMLGHMEILNELDTEGVEPLSHTFSDSCPLREDAVKPSLSADDILLNAPEKSDGFFTVPKAFE